VFEWLLVWAAFNASMLCAPDDYFSLELLVVRSHSVSAVLALLARLDLRFNTDCQREAAEKGRLPET
jgi:hypothetical protein